MSEPDYLDEDRDNEVLDLTQLISEGIDPEDARRVLGPHNALPRWEAMERYEMIQLEHERRATE